jgi:8-oxo-dGTP diphosphatase
VSTRDSAQHSVSVSAAVVAPDGRVLVVRRRDTGQWEPPGGVLELEETIEAGLRREVLEETGLVIEPVALTGVYKNMDRHIVALVFRATVVEGVPHPTDETTDIRWMTPDEVREHLDEAFAVRLIEAVKGHPVAVHAHDGVSLLD